MLEYFSDPEEEIVFAVYDVSGSRDEIVDILSRMLGFDFQPHSGQKPFDDIVGDLAFDTVVIRANVIDEEFFELAITNKICIFILPE